MVDHLYRVTVWIIPDAIEVTYDSHELDVPLDASAELAMSHFQQMLIDDPLEFFQQPTKFFVALERSDGDCCHASTSIAYDEGDDE